ADTGPERIKRSERYTLFEVVFVSHHAAFGAATGSRGIDNAGNVFSLARDKNGFARPAKLLPAMRTSEVGVRRSFGDKDKFYVFCTRAFGSGGELAPNRIFGDEDFRTRVFQQLPVFRWSQFVVERNERATGEENGVRRDQPLGLIGHDDAGAVAGGKTGILQSASERVSAVLELFEGEALLLAIAVGFNQARFVRKRGERVFQRRTDRLVFGKIQHYRRDWIRSARVRKLLTPCTSLSGSSMAKWFFLRWGSASAC